MKKQILFLLTLLPLLQWACGGSGGTTPAPAPVVPVSERIKKTWTVSSVQEGSNTVYTKGGSSNVRPGYSNWKLSLSGASAVSYTEFDNNTFSGTYELSGDTKLTLKNLNPQPTGTGGTIEFNMTLKSDTELILVRTSSSSKTGNTTNTYNLTSL